MKKIILAIVLLATMKVNAQYPAFTKWYQNPLGFKPLNLHTVNGILIPAAVATGILLLTKKDTSIADKFSVFTEMGWSQGWIADNTNIYQNNTGVLFHARKYMAIGTEFTTYYARDEKNNTFGIGVRPFVRFYPIHNKNFRLYFESGAGLIYFFDKFPKASGFFGDNRTGTRLNGSPKYGIGAEFNINRQLSLQAGLRHVHVSNGNTSGEENNPGHDSNGIALGMMYRFRGNPK